MTQNVQGSAITRDVEIINKKGLHARATAKFVQCADGFNADIFDTPPELRHTRLKSIVVIYLYLAKIVGILSMLSVAAVGSRLALRRYMMALRQV